MLSKHQLLMEAIKRPKDRSQFRPELLGLAALNPFPEFISSSRIQMFTSHIGQALVVDGAEERLCYTGMEHKLKDYTFSKRIPVEAEILEIIPKFKETMGESVPGNNNALIVYENMETNEIEMLELEHYFSLHQHFGFTYQPTETYHNLSVGMAVPRDTILADTPAVTPDGGYGYGVNANVAVMTIEGTIEDGVIVRRGFLEKLKTKGYGSRVLSLGSKKYGLNLYGDDDHYKVFPNIGDTVRADGLLCALRTKDEINDAVNLHPKRLRAVDYFADERIYAEPNARIVDIKIHYSPSRKDLLPSNMDEQLRKYWEVESTYRKNIVALDTRYRHRKVHPALEKLISQSMGYGHTRMDPVQRRQRPLNKTYRAQPLDEWRVEVIYEYDIIPDTGFKISGVNGDGFRLTGC